MLTRVLPVLAIVLAASAVVISIVAVTQPPYLPAVTQGPTVGNGLDGLDGERGATGPSGPQGIQGPVGGQGPVGRTGPARAYVYHHGLITTTEPSGFQRIALLDLPAGTYLLTYHADFESEPGEGNDYTLECAFREFAELPPGGWEASNSQLFMEEGQSSVTLTFSMGETRTLSSYVSVWCDTANSLLDNGSFVALVLDTLTDQTPAS